MKEFTAHWLFPFGGVGLMAVMFELLNGKGEASFIGGVVGIVMVKLYYALRRA